MLTTAEKVAFWLGQPVTIEIDDPYEESIKWFAECRPYSGNMIEVTWTSALTKANGQTFSYPSVTKEWFSKEELLSIHPGGTWWTKPLLELFPEDD